MTRIINNMNLEPRVKTLSETEKAYIAGLWDGEGYIGLTPRGERNAIRGAISVAVSNKEYMETISSILGIKCREEKSFRKVQKKAVYRINLSSQTDMLYFCKQIKPYLIMKREQAKLLIAFLEYRIERLLKATNMRQVPYGKYERSLMQKMYKLNASNYGIERRIDEPISTPEKCPI